MQVQKPYEICMKKSNTTESTNKKVTTKRVKKNIQQKK